MEWFGERLLSNLALLSFEAAQICFVTRLSGSILQRPVITYILVLVLFRVALRWIMLQGRG